MGKLQVLLVLDIDMALAADIAMEMALAADIAMEMALVADMLPWRWP